MADVKNKSKGVVSMNFIGGFFRPSTNHVPGTAFPSAVSANGVTVLQATRNIPSNSLSAYEIQDNGACLRKLELGSLLCLANATASKDKKHEH